MRKRYCHFLAAFGNCAKASSVRIGLTHLALSYTLLSITPATGSPLIDHDLRLGRPGFPLQLVAGKYDDDEKEPVLTPEQKMAKRYPQPVRVSFLLGLPVLDENSSIIGSVHAVVRTPEGKIQLVMPIGGFLGLGSRLVPIPIEIVGMLGAQVAIVDMPGDRFMSSPTWTSSRAKPLDPSETIRVAITRR
jgi:PRC-barrel domain